MGQYLLGEKNPRLLKELTKSLLDLWKYNLNIKLFNSFLLLSSFARVY